MNRIVSHPKCGRTWLRAMLAYAIGPTHDVELPKFMFSTSTFKKVEPTFPDCTHDAAVDAVSYDAMKLDTADFVGKRVLFLVRDPIDTVVSWYYHQTFRINNWHGDINAFVCDPQWGIRKIIRFYNRWYAARRVPVAFMPLAYESLRKYPAKMLRRVIRFFDLSPAYLRNVASAVHATTFERMQALERDRTVRLAVDRLRARGVPLDQPYSDVRRFKVRRGAIGKGVDELTPQTRTRCYRWMREMNCAYYVNKNAWRKS